MDSTLLSDTIFDYIFVGTTFPQCILAGALSLLKKKILQLDVAPTYGGLLSDFNLKQFHDFMHQRFLKESGGIKCLKANVDTSHESFVSKARSFLIELCPKPILGKSCSVDYMVKSEVSMYLEFQSLRHFSYVRNNKLYKIPLSKSEIFKTDIFSLPEKRMFVKLIDQCLWLADLSLNQEKNVNSLHIYESELGIKISEEDQKDILIFADKAFNEYAAAKKLSKNVIKIFEDVITQITFNPSQHNSLRDYSIRTAKFLRSIHQYSELPYLFSTYGCSEYPQAFSRLSAVFGATHIVNESFSIDSINLDSNNKFESINLSIEQNPIKGKVLLISSEYNRSPLMKSSIAPDDVEYFKYLTTIYEGKSEDQLPALLILSQDEENHSSPIYAIIKNESTNSTPNGMILVNAWAKCTKENDSSISNSLFNIHQTILNYLDIKATIIHYWEYNLYFPTNTKFEQKSENVFVSKCGFSQLDCDEYFETSQKLFELLEPSHEFLKRPEGASIMMNEEEEINPIDHIAKELKIDEEKKTEAEK